MEFFADPRPLLCANGIQKSFGGVKALVDGCFELRAGEVHAVMGENGAGKSTLGKILAGVFPAGGGTMTFDGEAFAPATPREAQSRGVAMIFQELDLFPNLSVAENVVTANLAYRDGRVVRRKAMADFARPFIEQVGLSVDPGRPVGRLSIGDQQRVAIARALSMKARIIVMDESTSALTEDAVETLFGVIRELRVAGVSVVYVSHKMEEIFAVCDRVTVLRDGATVASAAVADTSMDELVRWMVGREVLSRRQSAEREDSGAVVLEMDGVTTDAVRGIDLRVHAGEVVGIAGLVGAGRTEIGRALFGLDRLRAGTIRLRGEPFAPKGPRAAIRAGLGMVPEDRKMMGLMMQMAVRENGTLSLLPQLSRCGVVRGRAERERATAMATRTRLKANDSEAPVQTLSGGNQQKVLLGRWLLLDPDVLFLDDPTRGVDVGAKEDIYGMIAELAARGKAVLMVSSELPELLRCCDRILVMNQGELVGPHGGLAATTAEPEDILRLAALPLAELVAEGRS